MGGYRDDNEALRVRLEQREAELDAAKARIEELEGSDDSKAKANWFTGAPTTIEVQRTFDGMPSEDALEEVVSALRKEFGELGRLDRVGNTLAWTVANPQRNRVVEVSLEWRKGKTSYRIRERLGNMAGGIFGGIIGGVGGGASAGVVGLAMALGLPVAMMPVVVVGWVGAVYMGARALFKRVSRGREKQLNRTSRSLDALLREELKVRVDATAAPADMRVEEEEKDEALPPPLLEAD